MNLANHGITFGGENWILVTLFSRCIIKSSCLFAVCISVWILGISRCKLACLKRFLEADEAIVNVVVRNCVLLERNEEALVHNFSRVWLCWGRTSTAPLRRRIRGWAWGLLLLCLGNTLLFWVRVWSLSTSWNASDEGQLWVDDWLFILRLIVRFSPLKWR